MLAARVPFSTYHRINFIHIHSSHDSILHRPSLTRSLSFHLFLIRITLGFLLHNILLIFPPFLSHQPCSTTLVLKVLYNRILTISPPSRSQSLISFMQLPNHLIFHVLTLSIDGLIFLSNIRITSFMFVLLTPLKFYIV